MSSRPKKRQSPRGRADKDSRWLLPAALVLALGGGIAALLWPNPHLDHAAPEQSEARKPEIQKPAQQATAIPAAPSPRPQAPKEPGSKEPRPKEPRYEEAVPIPPPAAHPEAVPPMRPVPPVAGTAPRVAIVLDDMGLDQAAARRAADLPGVVTLAFLPYAKDLPAQTGNARAKGHELMVHMPMEPASASVDPGPNALRLGLDAAEIRRRLDANLSRFDGYVGFNNHMGSRFTTNTPGMRVVMEEARQRGLLFLDSRTTEGTVGASLARSMGVPYAQRDVFLDNSRDPAAIRRQLGELEILAQKHGMAIAIGHPHPETLAVLERWIPEARAAGYVLVPLSALVKGGNTVAAAPAVPPAAANDGDGG